MFQLEAWIPKLKPLVFHSGKGLSAVFDLGKNGVLHLTVRVSPSLKATDLQSEHRPPGPNYESAASPIFQGAKCEF